MRIRAAQAADAEMIARAEWATALTPGQLVGWPGEIPAQDYAAKIVELAPIGSYWVVEDAGRALAHAFLEPLPMRGNAHVFTLTIVVHPGETDRGVGKALMTHMLAWARAHEPLQKIELSVRATNDRAIDLYRRFGFVEEGRRRVRVLTPTGELLDDVLMAWFPRRNG